MPHAPRNKKGTQLISVQVKQSTLKYTARASERERGRTDGLPGEDFGILEPLGLLEVEVAALE